MKLHFIVTSTEFSYPYYLSVLTALKTQKVSSTTIWTTGDIDSPYLSLLAHRVAIKKLPEYKLFPALEGQAPYFVDAHFKDYLTYKILYEQGGVCMDLDTISLKDITTLLSVDKQMLVPSDADSPDEFYYHYNSAILIGRKGSPFLKAAQEKAYEILNKAETPPWGATGPILVTELVLANKEFVYTPPFRTCGGFRGYEVLDVYKEDADTQLAENVRVIHLFAVVSNKNGNLFNKITPEFILESKSLLARTVRNLLPKKEWYPMPEKYFVEIGANYFDTLVGLAKDGWGGLVVEPVEEYFEKLEEVEGVSYANVAIGNKTGSFPFYYLSEKDIVELGLPAWARGLGSLYQPHPLIKENGWSHLVKTQTVEVMSVDDLLKTFSIKKIDYLKIDTEGMDCEILSQFDVSGIEKILFEHKHCKQEEIDREIKRLKANGFKIEFMGDNVSAEKENIPAVSSNVTLVHSLPARFRFHLASLVHLPQSREYLSCAFSQKNRKLAKMLTSLGHEVFFYGAEGSDVEEYCNSDNLHFIQTHTLQDIAASWGEGDNRYEIGYNWHETDFRHDFDSERKPATLKYYKVVTDYINANKKPDDFFLNTMGYYYKPIEDQIKLFLNCESGIGYRGSYGSANHFRAFESLHIQSFSYGSGQPFGDMNGCYYDRIIPNYFDPDDIEYSAEKGDYYLYIGRMIKRKGILSAVHACNAIGAKLIIAGQGASVRENGHLVQNSAVPEFDIAPLTWEYVGFKGVEERKKLMAHAIACFVPTEYLEIFGGTHVESRLSGTPVLTSNFGVFPGTVEDGVDGYKCDTLDDFVWNAKKCKELDPIIIRMRAERYLMDNVKWEYQKWFEDLYRLYLSATYPGIEKGWMHINTVESEYRKHLYNNF
jgi:FkbM family methyltransferase